MRPDVLGSLPNICTGQVCGERRRWDRTGSLVLDLGDGIWGSSHFIFVNDGNGLKEQKYITKNIKMGRRFDPSHPHSVHLGSGPASLLPGAPPLPRGPLGPVEPVWPAPTLPWASRPLPCAHTSAIAPHVPTSAPSRLSQLSQVRGRASRHPRSTASPSPRGALGTHLMP